ncbi:efflux RND transporter periplasmic adaptor subunit [Pontibacterium granulatum]|uniref:efflux RND transporter periplasmic adaptor subunit n=1 Tax=Pontibacterium granulatum TaxID=2036029 RepID=UPI00249A4B51|nr:efflux RND transporter periplasmic adaptor subunit [Pontibacterium granulatum]MDI3326362.1 efflux RND transporter periplasmic adaptor subunit [Pontibacterium granulatum]
MLWRKLMLVVSGILFLGTAQAQETGSRQEIVRPAKLLTIENPLDQQIRTFPAEVKATSRTELAFRIPGELNDLVIQEGQPVTKGQLLARLDPADYQVVLDQRRAQYRLAKAQYDRFDKMLKRKLVSAAQYDEKRAELDVARAALRRAELDMKYTELRAPYDGTISQRMVDNYQNVQAKEPVIVIQSGDQIDIEFQVPEWIAALPTKPDAREQRADIFFDALPDQSFKAEYRERTAEADPKTGSYSVTLSMLRPGSLEVFPGMTASVRFDLNRVFELDTLRFVLPVEAVFAAEDTPLNSNLRQIWKVSPETMKVSRFDVEIGEITSNGIEILSGLSAGDIVVTAGVHHLREGMKVRQWKRERGI